MPDDIKFIVRLLLLCSLRLFVASDDTECVRTLHKSLVDPRGELKSTWNFSGEGTNGFICKFTGVNCWSPNDNTVRSFNLVSLGLQGRFPEGLEGCRMMEGLNLSGNSFSGPIPSDISRWLPHLSYLDLSHNSFSGPIPSNITELSRLSSMDLSYNSFSGPIPANIRDMAYLETLSLQHNKLQGGIPWQFCSLARPVSFSVSDNLLSGLVPPCFENFSASAFAGNRRLCGAPLGSCRLHGISDESIIGAAVGFVVGFVMAFYFPQWFVFSRRLHPYIFRI
ncbi:probably inactive leucine-rich repeat receptor-like protein kinase At5g48380 [Oryza brachyantha]|uniref:probably inactive leucine-rich repeat receptor-like protein kinase At5g48380 n=1 Tax=Oryza brachyantha TaxID=4533 RepID=UPI0003EACF1F|nr:probably inactive leucine-rich repeat receptor-like protein kinase At5g48380 [Oryza brachyantha]